ncbi:MAG TPA: DNA polymerase III subunit gamma/tau [Ktedonobacterales bacterium]
MASHSLYRKWRSQTFSDLIGQEATVRTLRHAVRDGRVAHAYLFRGPRGTGKTSVARLLAKAVNCANPHDGEPCDECVSCREIAEGRSPDVIEIDAASNNGVDNIRDLREHVNVLSSGGRFRVFIIDEAHMLSTQAFNALLKTLEEPPPHIIFVLATTESHKVLPTIVSRCQPFDFRRISHRDSVARLRHVAEGEELTLEPAAADLLARAARGGLRDALSLLDQAMAFCGTAIDLAGVRAMLGLADPGAVRALAEYVADGQTAAGLHLIQDLVEAGADLRQLNSQMAEYWRALVLARAGADVSRVMDRGDDEAREIAALAQRFSLEELTACARVFVANETPARGLPVPQLGLELSFLECLGIRRHGGAVERDAASAPAPSRDSQRIAEAPRPDAPRHVAAPTRPTATLPPAGMSPGMSRPEAQPPVAQPDEGEIEELDLDMFESGATRGRAGGSLRSGGQPPPMRPASPPPSLARDGETPPIVAASAPAAGPPPAPAMPGGAAAGGAAIDTTDATDWLGRARNDWVLIRKICKQKSGKIYGLLAAARPIQLRAGDPPVLVIAADHDFHLRSLREPANSAVVEWALAQVFEAPCRMRVVLAGSAEATAEQAPTRATTPDASTPRTTARATPPGTAPATTHGAPGANSANGAGHGANGATPGPVALGAHGEGSGPGRSSAAVAKAATGSDAGDERRGPAARAAAESPAVRAAPGAADAAGATSRAPQRADTPASEPASPPRAADEALEVAARADPVVREILRSYPTAVVEVRPLDPDETG